MLVIGLTGGIGSGKSTAANLFSELGVEVIDTDAIAHQLTAPGQPAIDLIASTFGAQYVTLQGSLDRAAMRKLVFEDHAAKQQLENILHPLIRTEVAAQLRRPAMVPYRIIVVPLLFETDSYGSLIQRILVIDCPEALQTERAMSRSKLTETEVQAIIAAQIPRTERLQRGDDIIVNDSSLESLTNKVNEMHKKYIRLA